MPKKKIILRILCLLVVLGAIFILAIKLLPKKNRGVNKKETSNPYNKATVDYINDLASYHVYGDDKGYYLDYDSMIESDFYQGLKSEKPFEITKEQYQKILSIDYDKSEAIKEGEDSFESLFVTDKDGKQICYAKSNEELTKLLHTYAYDYLTKHLSFDLALSANLEYTWLSGSEAVGTKAKDGVNPEGLPKELVSYYKKYDSLTFLGGSFYSYEKAEEVSAKDPSGNFIFGEGKDGQWMAVTKEDQVVYQHGNRTYDSLAAMLADVLKGCME